MKIFSSKSVGLVLPSRPHACGLIAERNRCEWTPAELCALLPCAAIAVLVENYDIGLSRRGHPFSEFALAHRELLAHLDKLLALPHLQWLEVSTQSHGWGRIQQRHNYALRVFSSVIEKLEMKSDLYEFALVLGSANIEVAREFTSVTCGSNRYQQ